MPSRSPGIGKTCRSFERLTCAAEVAPRGPQEDQGRGAGDSRRRVTDHWRVAPAAIFAAARSHTGPGAREDWGVARTFVGLIRSVRRFGRPPRAREQNTPMQGDATSQGGTMT